MKAMAGPTPRAALRAALCLAFLWRGWQWIGTGFALQGGKNGQVSSQRLRRDQGLELNTGAGSGNFVPINGNGGQKVTTDEEMGLASELRAAANHGDWPEARRILSTYYGSNTKVLTAGMQAAFKSRKYSAGAVVFQQLQDKEGAIDLPAYTVAMKIYGKLKNREKVDEIWSTLMDLEVVDQVAAGARIDAAVDFGDMTTALEVVQMMIKDRLGISVVHFSSAINACASSDDPERHKHALRLWNDMISRGIKPNIVTFTNLLKASRDLPQQDLLDILHNMKKKGVEANHVFVENFIFAFLEKERGQGRPWKTVENIQHDLYDNGFDEETLEKALELIKSFGREGISFNRSTKLIYEALSGMLETTRPAQVLPDSAKALPVL